MPYMGARPFQMLQRLVLSYYTVLVLVRGGQGIGIFGCVKDTIGLLVLALVSGGQGTGLWR